MHTSDRNKPYFFGAVKKPLTADINLSYIPMIIAVVPPLIPGSSIDEPVTRPQSIFLR